MPSNSSPDRLVIELKKTVPWRVQWDRLLARLWPRPARVRVRR
jgi:hypothetical protein